MTTTRNRRRIVEGTVTSDKMDKSITVLVDRTFRHPKYGKYLRKQVKYHAHDEEQIAKVGDLVEIVECRPMSRLKRWRIVRVVKQANTASLVEFNTGGGAA